APDVEVDREPRPVRSQALEREVRRRAPVLVGLAELDPVVAKRAAARGDGLGTVLRHPEAPHADPRQMGAQPLDALHALLPPAPIGGVAGRMEHRDDVRGVLPRRAEHLRLPRELEVPMRSGLEGPSQLAERRILELDVAALRALLAGMPLD